MMDVIKVMTIKVMIVDDHPFIRLGIRSTIASEPGMQVVFEAPGGLAAIQYARQSALDVILVDLALPDIPGVQVIETILKDKPGVKLLVCSNFSDDQHIIASLQAGAIGYLLKTDPPEKIIQAIRDAFEGKTTLSRLAESSLISHLQHQPARPAPTPELTGREIEILKLMAGGKSNAEIAAQCFISEGTVRTHISHIQAKLNLDSRAKLVIYAVREGLISI